MQEQIKECKNRIAVLLATSKKELDDELQLTPNKVFEHCKSWTRAQQVEHAEKLFRASVSHGSITVDGALGVIACHGLAREKQKANLLLRFEEENARLRQSHDRLEAALREYKAANPSDFQMSPQRVAHSAEGADQADGSGLDDKPPQSHTALFQAFADALQPGTESSAMTCRTVGSVASNTNGSSDMHPETHMPGVQDEIVDFDGGDLVPAEVVVFGIPNSKSPARASVEDKEVFQFGSQPPDPGGQTKPVKSALRTSRSTAKNLTVDVVDEDGESRKAIVAGKTRDADPLKVAEAGNSLRTTNTLKQRNAAKEALLKERRAVEDGDAQDQVKPELVGSDPAMSQTQALDLNGNVVYKETGEAISMEDLGRVLRNPPEMVATYIFKKEGQPFTLEEIQGWQEAHGIQDSEMEAHAQSKEVAEGQGLDASRAATLNHRIEPMVA